MKDRGRWLPHKYSVVCKHSVVMGCRGMTKSCGDISTYKCTLLLACGYLADVYCSRKAIAVSRKFEGIGFDWCIRAGVGMKDLLDLGVVESGELEVEPELKVVECGDILRHE